MDFSDGEEARLGTLAALHGLAIKRDSVSGKQGIGRADFGTEFTSSTGRDSGLCAERFERND